MANSPTSHANLVLVENAAVRVAQRDGWANLRRHTVAIEAGVSAGSVSNAYGSLDALRDAVMRRAVEAGDVAIIGQGLAVGHAVARAAPDALRTAAAMALCQ